MDGERAFGPFGWLELPDYMYEIPKWRTLQWLQWLQHHGTAKTAARGLLEQLGNQHSQPRWPQLQRHGGWALGYDGGRTPNKSSIRSVNYARNLVDGDDARGSRRDFSSGLYIRRCSYKPPRWGTAVVTQPASVAGAADSARGMSGPSLTWQVFCAGSAGAARASRCRKVVRRKTLTDNEPSREGGKNRSSDAVSQVRLEPASPWVGVGA